jgi:hypothetical protein
VIVPFVAIKTGAGAVELVALRTGSLITVRGEVRQSGFLDVLCEGQLVAVFARDMQRFRERPSGSTY